MAVVIRRVHRSKRACLSFATLSFNGNVVFYLACQTRYEKLFFSFIDKFVLLFVNKCLNLHHKKEGIVSFSPKKQTSATATVPHWRS